MRHASYNSVLTRVLGLAGIKPADLTAEEDTLLNGYINTALKLAWEFYWWPELMRSELRYYRDPYDAATAYVAGDEIYYATTGKYYTCILASTGNLPTHTTYWEEATELDAYIELEQEGETAIGEVRGVFWDDPLTTERPRRIPHLLGPSGIHLPGTSLPLSAYVYFRLRPSEYTGADYNASTAYTVGQTMYYSSGTVGYDGDYWECITATSIGQNPETHAAKWSRIQFPAWLKEAVAGRAYAEYLITDSAPQESRDRAEASAAGLLLQALHLLTGQQRQSLGRVA